MTEFMASKPLVPTSPPPPPDGFVPIDALNAGNSSLAGSMVSSVAGTPPDRATDPVSQAIRGVPRPPAPDVEETPEARLAAGVKKTLPTAEGLLMGTPPGMAYSAAKQAVQGGKKVLDYRSVTGKFPRYMPGTVPPTSVKEGAEQAGISAADVLGQSTVGVSPSSVYEDIKNKNYAGAAGQVVGGMGQALLLHELQAKAIDPRAAKIVDEVKAQGGTTHSMRLGNMDGSNHYAVSAFPETTTKIEPNEFTPERVDAFMKQHADLLNAHPNAAVGAWSAPDGNLYLEVSATTPDRANALDVARKHNQMSIFDLKNRQDIPSGGTGGLDTPTRDPYLMAGASAYNKMAGLPPAADTVHVQKDARGPEMADAYDAMRHDPNDPKVKASYDALKKEVKQQYHFAHDVMGINFEPSEQDPYSNINQMLDDVRNNHRLKIWLGGAPPADHPLSEIDPETGLSMNTLFRGVHDVFGHGATGEDFSEAGEENAWLKHKQMFSKEATPALTTETRGQANWFFNNKNARAGQPWTFPEQKAGILPDEFQHRGEIDRFKDIKAGPQKQPYAGLHYSNAKTQVLEGARRGLVADQGRPAGQEADRLRLGSHLGHGQDAPGGVYVYDQGTLGEPSITSRKYSYSVKGNKALADISNNDVWDQAKQTAFDDAKAKGASDTQAHMLSLNAAEHALQDAGYDGYYNGANKKMSNVKFLFGDHPAETVGAPPKNQVPREVPAAVGAGAGKVTSGTFGSTEDMVRGLAKAFPNHPAFNPEVRRSGFLKPEENAQLTHDQPVPESSAAVASRSGTAAGATKETDIFNQVRAQHPDWTLGQQLQEAAKVSENASGESAASLEAISRQASERAQGVKYFRRDTRSGKEVPLIGPDALDARAGPYDEIVRRGPDGETVLDRGRQARPSPGLHPEAGVVRAGVPRKGLGGRKFVEQPDIANDAAHHEGDPADVFSLNHDERAQLGRGRDRWERFKNYLSNMPSVQEFVDAARAGAVGRKWYQQSRQAFQHLMEEAPEYFHPDDMEKFSNVIAATSPNQAVVQNLREGLNFWEEWHKQDRPTDPAQIEKIANLTLEKDRSAKIPNLIKAITGQDLLGEAKEDYYKVGNFAGSLRGPGDFVANDTHQGTFAEMTNKNKKALTGPEGYHALSSRTRDAAKILGWEPREAQAAIWTFWKTLKMMSGAKDVKDVPMFQDIEAVKGARPTEVLPHIDDASIRQYAQHFGDLMRSDTQVRDTLKRLGVNLDALDAKLKTIPEATPLEAGEQAAALKHLEPTARRLEKQWDIKPPKRGEASEVGLEGADTSFVPDIIRKAVKGKK